MSSFGGTVKLTGESEYRAALKEISSNLKVLNSEMKAVTSEYDKNDKSVSNLSAQNDVLNKKIDEQKSKVDILTEALEKSKEETGDNSATTQKWQIELNNAQADLNKLNRELDTNAEELETARKEAADLEEASKKVERGFSGFTKAVIECGSGSRTLGEVFKGTLSNGLEDLNNGLGDVSGKTKSFLGGIKELNSNTKEMGVVAALSVAALKLFKDEMDETGEEVKETGEEEEKTGEKTIKLGDLIKANLISDAIKGGLTALVDGFKALGSAMGDCLTEGAAYADNLLTLSAQTGLSTDTLEKYNAVAELTDVSLDTLTKSMSKNIKSMSDARDGSKAYAEAYEKLGVQITNTDGSLRDSEDVYWETIDALKGVEDETERDALAMELFGKKAQELNTIIDMGSEGVAEYTDKAIAMGAVVGEDALAALGNLDDQMQIFKSTTSATSNIIASAFAPEIADVIGMTNGLLGAVNGLTAGILSGNVTQDMVDEIGYAMSDLLVEAFDVASQIAEIAPVLIDTLITVITDNLPWVLEMGIELVNRLVNGIVGGGSLNKIMGAVFTVIQTLTTTLLQNLPTILQMGIQLLVSLIQGISSTLPEMIPTVIDAVILVTKTLLANLDLVIDAGIELIFALVDGLIEATPELIDQIPYILGRVISAITQNLPKILQAGISLVVKIGEGLVQAIPQLISKVPQLIIMLANGFKSAWSTVKNIGKDLIKGIWNGIDDATSWILTQIKSFGSAVLKGIKNIFGIHSPSTVFRDEVGKNLALGVGEGFSDTMADVSAEMQSAIPTEFDASVTANMSGGQVSTYDMMVGAFKKALSEVKVVLDDREMGGFVTDTVERAVFA